MENKKYGEDAASEIQKELTKDSEMKVYGLDVSAELERIFAEEILKATNEDFDRKYSSQIEDFMTICNNDLESLYQYLVSPHQGIRLGNIDAGEYIERKYNNSSYLIREKARVAEYLKGYMMRGEL